ncbi:MAG: hypothetical protein KatS3mg109_0523 [Pirellulaceae bacterium]|nr:MAG: hypothetical protein KatS3mg109_0523 [Pirellulaceae bacterium]
MRLALPVVLGEGPTCWARWRGATSQASGPNGVDRAGPAAGGPWAKLGDRPLIFPIARGQTPAVSRLPTGSGSLGFCPRSATCTPLHWRIAVALLVQPTRAARFSQPRFFIGCGQNSAQKIPRKSFNTTPKTRPCPSPGARLSKTRCPDKRFAPSKQPQAPIKQRMQRCRPTKLGLLREPGDLPNLCPAAASHRPPPSFLQLGPSASPAAEPPTRASPRAPEPHAPGPPATTHQPPQSG